jgi:hypothetical protein
MVTILPVNLGYGLLVCGAAALAFEFFLKRKSLPWSYLGALLLAWGFTLVAPAWIPQFLWIVVLTLVAALFVKGLFNIKWINWTILIIGFAVAALNLLGVGVDGALYQVQSLINQVRR